MNMASARLPLPRRSLRVKFVVAIGALVALVLAAQATVQAISGRQTLRSDIESHGRSFGALAVRPLCEAYETYYRSGYGKFRAVVLDLMRLDPDLERIRLYDTSGHLLFDSFELADPMFDPASHGLEPPLSDPALLAGVRGLRAVSWRTADVSRFVVVVPYVEDWGRHRYSAVFEVSYASLATATKASAWRILALTVVALAVGVAIAGLLARQSLEPVEELTRGARALAEGTLDRRLKIATGDEFESLAATFNLMAERLQRTISDLERSNHELSELDRLKSDLLANVSHELRTPLTALQGYAEALDDGLLGPVTAAQREALAVMAKNVVRLRAMIDQLLTYSRLDSGAGELNLEAVDVPALVRQAVANARALAPAGVVVEMALEPGLPTVLADAGKLAQVLDNLLTNALKFTSRGAVTVAASRVRLTPVGGASGGEQVEIAVRDTGIGISAEQQEHIFDRFYQVDGSSTRRYGGMGLGLAIVREILTAHHTSINVDSALGHGSTFQFRLPVARSEELTAVRPPVPTPGRRLLLVDDDPVFLDTIAALLLRQGYSVETAGTLAAGLAAARARRPDLVLLDRLLPDGDGFDLLAALAADPQTETVPVLVVSIKDERALGLKLGAAGYLVKPIDPEALRRAVAGALPSASDRTGAAPLVLVVDDEPDLRRLLAGRLRGDGLRVAEAENGAAALSAVAADPPQLVLLDLMMPDLDGWQVLRQLRADPATASLPVIVLTARDTAEDRATGSALGVVDYVHKPFDLGALVGEIEACLVSRLRKAD